MAEKKKSFWGTVVRRDPAARHSMYETGSQPNLDKSFSDTKSRNDVPVTSQSASGSVDRLSALGKKPPRSGIFHFKSKSSFWKPLLKHSTVTSTAPLISTSMRDTHAQTEPPLHLTNDFGVQTVDELPTHTCDVLVQTCFAWDETATLPCDRFSTPTNCAKPLPTSNLGNRSADYVRAQSANENNLEETSSWLHSPTPHVNGHDNEEVNQDSVVEPDFLANVQHCSLVSNPDSPNEASYTRYEFISSPREVKVREVGEILTNDPALNSNYLLNEESILEDFIKTFSEPTSPASTVSKEKSVFSWPSDFSVSRANHPQNVKPYNVVSFPDTIAETSDDAQSYSRLKIDFDSLRNNLVADSNQASSEKKHIKPVEVPTPADSRSNFDVLRQDFSKSIPQNTSCSYDLISSEVTEPKEQGNALIMKDQLFSRSSENSVKKYSVNSSNRAFFSEEQNFQPTNEWDSKLSEELGANRWSAMSVDSEKDRSDPCSSSNTSCRGSSASGMEALYVDSFKFDSCENLDQLEDEIIRSLCSPIEEIYDNECEKIEENNVFKAARNPSQNLNTQRMNEINESSSQSNEENTGAIKHMNTAGVKVREEIIDKLIRGEASDKNQGDHVKEQQEINSNRTIDEQSSIRNQFMVPSAEVNVADPEGNVAECGQNDGFKFLSRYSMQFEVPSSRPTNQCIAAQSNTKNVRFEDDLEESIVEVLPCQAKIMPNILEVRRSSWSTVGSTALSPLKENPQPKPILEDDLSKFNNTDSINMEPGIDRDEPKDVRCLKPSQVQQSVFAGELSALHAKRASPERVNDVHVPSEIYINSSPTRTSSAELMLSPNYSLEQDCCLPEVKMKTEIHITLKPSEVNSKISPFKDTGSADTASNISCPCPPPLPPYKPLVSKPFKVIIKDHQSDSVSTMNKQDAAICQDVPPKDPIMLELEQKFLSRQKIANDLEGIANKIASSIHPDTKNLGTVQTEDSESVSRNSSNSSPNSHMNSASPQRHENSPSFCPAFKASGPKAVWMPSKEEDKHGNRSNIETTVIYPERHNQNQNWSTSNKSPERCNNEPEQSSSPLKNHCNGSFVYHQNGVNVEDEPTYTGRTVITDVAPPQGAVLIDQRVTVDGDKIHTDKYYAVPIKEVLKEKTSTTKFIPAPPKYEGIGPTEEGIPTSLRQSVKKENMSDWYKTMYKTLHKVDDAEGDTYIVGYTSEPEIGREEKRNRTKSATLDYRQKSGYNYPPSAKSTIEVYNVHPRPIEDFEPGYSSVTDNETNTGSRRFLPALNPPKPLYEFKDGYESETSVVKKLNQPDGPNPEQQKVWYREVQRGGEIPQYGLGKLAPEKHKDPVVGPPPPPPLNYPKHTQYPQVTRPSTLPPENLNHFDDSYGEHANGPYANQMRQAIHSELQQRMYPGSPLSPNNKTTKKPSAKSPEMKMVARILYDFSAETPRELSLKKDEVVLIYKQLDKNWYEGEYKFKVGIFPLSYVEILPPEHVSPKVPKPEEGLAKALYDFPAQTSVELQIKKGEEIHLIRKVDDNWYEGRIKGRKGIIPSSYIYVIQEPGEKNNLQSQRPVSATTQSLKRERMDVSQPSSLSPSSTHSISPRLITNGVNQSSQNGFSRRMKKGSCLIEPVLYRALYGYSPQNADELELLDGDTVYVVEMCDDGWYVGTSVRTGVFGIFPGNYVEKV